MWVKVHCHAPTEPRPWEWVARSQGFVELQGVHGYRVSAMVEGSPVPHVDPAEHASQDAARDAADALLARCDPHDCGERCMPWKLVGEPVKERGTSRAPEL